MDQIAQWRPAEPVGPDGQPDQKSAAGPVSNNDRWHVALIGLAGAAIIGAAGVALWATTPQPELILEPASQAGVVAQESPSPDRPEIAAETDSEELLVDVQGAVERPGLHRLAAGSRVGDAIAAAGGYSAEIDITAAAQRLNLAQRIIDGDKVHVPARGEEAWLQPTASTAEGPSGGADTSSGLIDLNTATEAQLDTLPGIGPVTAGKIIAARAESAFASVDELLGRKVVGPATFEKIRELVTVTP
jgi:competence protein ComEA